MPIKSLEDLKTALEGNDLKDDVINFFVEQVESEKSRGIQERRKANDEAKGLRAYKKAFERLGYTGESDLESYLDGLEEKLQNTSDPKVASEMERELKKLRKDFDKAQNELNQEREKALSIKRESDKKTLLSELSKKLQDKVYGPDIVAENLVLGGKVNLAEDGSIHWLEGEDSVALDDGLKNYIESRPDIVRNVQRPGAGSPPSNGSGKKFSFDQIQSMSRDEIRENLSTIKESLGIKK